MLTWGYLTFLLGCLRANTSAHGKESSRMLLPRAMSMSQTRENSDFNKRKYGRLTLE